ncbi:MAG: hypothetical protein ABS52_15970 [Gemmatimonadetes bacterium SCN 70-22]|nr:MAG: hypothetical protein ABS52_15970 [Gemmatimonadetes bacterium SCN 70-22]
MARRSAEQLSAYFAEFPHSWELIVVDDGGGDFPVAPFDDLPGVRLLTLPHNHGKGAAVRAGMLAATGDVRIFTDVDLPYDLDLIPTISAIIRERGFHVVIGDRSLPESRYIAELTPARKAASAIFTTFVGTMVTGGFFDTQCGLKGVRGDVADELFRLQRLDRFAFDVELIYLALKHKLDVHRIPVQLRNNETSSVRLWRDAARGFVDVFRIKANQLRGVYASDRLEAIRQREFEEVRARATSGAAISRTDGQHVVA